MSDYNRPENVDVWAYVDGDICTERAMPLDPRDTADYWEHYMDIYGQTSVPLDSLPNDWEPSDPEYRDIDGDVTVLVDSAAWLDSFYYAGDDEAAVPQSLVRRALADSIDAYDTAAGYDY